MEVDKEGKEWDFENRSESEEEHEPINDAKDDGVYYVDPFVKKDHLVRLDDNGETYSVVMPPRTRCTKRCNRCVCATSIVAVLLVGIISAAIVYSTRMSSPGPVFISIAGPSPPEAENVQYSSIVLSWSTPGFDPMLVESYGLERANGVVSDDSDDGAFTQVYNGTLSRTTVSDLTPETAYTFRVRFLSANMQMSNYSETASFTTLTPTAPDAPSSAVLVGTSTSSLSVQWEAPAANGADITEYEVKATDPSGEATSSTASATSATVDGLASDTVYEIALSATNSVGTSDWSAAISVHTDSNNISPPSAPSPPSIAEEDTTRMEIQWQAGEEDGGAEVIESTVSMFEGACNASNPQWDVVYQGPLFTALVTGLAPSTSYAVQVVTSNNAGPSPPACAHLATADPGAPSAPPAPFATTATQASIGVQWLPAAPNGADVDQYELQANVSASKQVHAHHTERAVGAVGSVDAEEFETVYSGSDMSFNVTGLSAGMVVAFRVRAHNSIGFGPYSEVGALATLGVCNDPQDIAGLSTDPDAWNQQFNKCGTQCLGGASCVSNCIADAEDLTSACADCFGELTKCSKNKCFTSCVGGSSDKCDTCTASNCLAPLTACIGIPCSMQPILNDYCTEYGGG